MQEDVVAAGGRFGLLDGGGGRAREASLGRRLEFDEGQEGRDGYPSDEDDVRGVPEAGQEGTGYIDGEMSDGSSSVDDMGGRADNGDEQWW